MTENTVVYATSNGIEASKQEEKQKKVQLHVSPDRMDSVKVGTWRKVEDGKVSGMAELVGMFLWNGHSYLTKKEAETVIDDMTTAELKETASQLTDAIGNTVASPQ